MQPRDYDALYRNGRCRVCDTPAHAESVEAHANTHLATAECVIQRDYSHEPPTERVLVTQDVPTHDDDGSIWDCTTSADPERKDFNSSALRAAYAKAAELNRALKARIRAAAKEAK